VQFIKGYNRHQTCFSTLEDQMSEDNTVSLIDAFIDMLELQKLSFFITVNHKRNPTLDHTNWDFYMGDCRLLCLMLCAGICLPLKSRF
jgi:hypothetical protein